MNKTMQNSRYSVGKKIASVFLSAAMLASSFVGLGDVLTTSSPVDAASAADYGLMDTCQEGVILHAWEWSFNNIKANMSKIAEAGYTSVQTSVIQRAKEGTKGKTNEVWWVYYQPAEFVIDNTGNSALGTKAEFTAMCEEAHKYGIHVIVDVVANHLGNQTKYDLSNAIPSDIRNDSGCWHSLGFEEIGDYNNRYRVINGSMGGLPDLNTESTKIQNYVKTYLRECIDCGADGFRFDAAKHIGVPSDGSQFWPTVISDATSYYKQKGTYKDVGLYCYGEILDGTAGPAISEYTQYMSVTDNTTGNSIRGSVAGHNASSAAKSNYDKGASPSKTVLWAESHDTYSNDGKESTYVSDSDINKTWALVGSRNNATALYFARTAGWRGGKIGDICSTQCFNKEVVEVNKFHNAFNGESEYVASSGSIAYIERGTSGVVLVNCNGGSQQVSVKANKMAAGTYTDQVTGNTFTVANGQISGQIGSTGIAVVYNAGPIVKSAKVSATPGSSGFTDSVTVKLGVVNADSGTYTTSDGQSGTFTNGKTITLGASAAIGGQVTLTLSATGEDGVKKTETYTYTKKDPNAITKVYFDNSSYKWSNVYVYIYNSGTSQESSTQTSQTSTQTSQTSSQSSSGTILFSDTLGWGSVNAYFFNSAGTVDTAWPGKAMDSNGTNEFGQKQFKASIPSGATMVIFNHNGTQTGDLPLAGVTGYYCDGSASNCKSWTSSGSGAYALNAKTTSTSASTVECNAAWPGVKMTLNSTTGLYEYTVPDNLTEGLVIFSDGVDGTTNRYPADEKPGMSLGGISMKFSAGNKWEAYSDTPTPTVPTVTSNKTSGSSFTTETMDIKLTLANATSGTYSVDGGPTKTFTSSATVTIGEGKIGDSTVTVAATAKGSDGTTKNYTFTYEKKYVKKTSSGAALTSYYSTNKAGKGVKKTITVDGDISDWDSTMIIAQGAANDDPRVYRTGSMHELPVDLYTLYGAYDDNNIYLMWEMTNVQDVVAPGDDYPLSQGILWQTQELPFFIAIDTGKSSDAIGNKGQLQTGGTIWASGLTFASSFNRLISINTKGGNGPFVYGGNSTGLNAVEIYDATTSKIKMKYGKGILSTSVVGIDGAYGEYNDRVVGDMTSDSAAWVDFNTKGHASASMDFFYEMSIPYSELGITKSDVTSNGVGVLLIGTFGLSGMDCLPYDLSMNDNADQPDTQSQAINSFEKSDEDYITTSFARIGKSGGTVVIDDPTPVTTPLQVNFGTDKSAPQLTTTSLTLKGIGYGGTAPYQYTFYVDGNVVKAKSTTATYTWKPGTTGKHTIKCIITDSTGATATTEKTFTAEGENVVSNITNNTTVSSTTVVEGNKVTFTGAATGGTAPYTYTYEYQKSGKTNWVNFGTGATMVFKPGIGTYTVKVTATDSTGASAAKTFTITCTGGATGQALANNSTISATTIASGGKVTITGKASGGTSPYTYKYEYQKAGKTTWTSFGSGTAAVFKPGDGTYTIKVTITDSASKSVAKSFTVTCGTASTTALTNNSTVSATSFAIDKYITITGKASGGTSPYTYKYMYKKSTNTTWNNLGTGSAVNFKPGNSATYDIKITVTDAAGKTVDKQYTVTCGSSTTGGTLTNSTTASATTIASGGKVTFTGKATGGTSPYTYKYQYLKSGKTTWVDFATTANAALKPGDGTYTVKVTVTDAAGKTAVKSFTITCGSGSSTTTLTNSSTVSGVSFAVGKYVTVTGKASGGTSPYTYKYQYKKSTNTTWNNLGTGSAVNFKPGTAASYDILVTVTDAAGKTATKQFTVVFK